MPHPLCPHEITIKRRSLWPSCLAASYQLRGSRVPSRKIHTLFIIFCYLLQEKLVFSEIHDNEVIFSETRDSFPLLEKRLFHMATFCYYFFYSESLIFICESKSAHTVSWISVSLPNLLYIFHPRCFKAVVPKLGSPYMLVFVPTTLAIPEIQQAVNFSKYGNFHAWRDYLPS